jgi:diadenosine tetraphosphatase ApaH/serine/threonine PP2A family protein phosphatase
MLPHDGHFRRDQGERKGDTIARFRGYFAAGRVRGCGVNCDYRLFNVPSLKFARFLVCRAPRGCPPIGYDNPANFFLHPQPLPA